MTTQPVQQVPLTQNPLVQGVISLRFVSTQAPVEQSAVLHVLLVVHLAQVAPALPHVERLLPPWQLLPSQQPPQQTLLLQVPPLQGAPLRAGTDPHLPAPHVSMVHGFLSSHTVHALPPAPQLMEVAPDWQTPPLMHPAQHAPPRQSPPVHAVPSFSPLEPHLPAVHEAAVQVPAVGQTEQVEPPVPQEDRLVPVWQVEPLQQPVQQVPLLQVPPLQAVPLMAGVVTHLFWLQESMRQGVPEEQLEHLEPAGPQALLVVPGWQVEPSQQPVQHLPA